MLGPHGESVAASAPGHCGHQPETPTAVDLRSLPPGTELVIETRNSRYRLAMLDDGSKALVQGGRHCKEATTARVDGCTLGSSLLKRGWIAVGCCFEMSIRGRRIVTSHVQSISVNFNSAADLTFR
jgi:hypothetical protein